jgi:hypothetical protein
MEALNIFDVSIIMKEYKLAAIAISPFSPTTFRWELVSNNTIWWLFRAQNRMFFLHSCKKTFLYPFVLQTLYTIHENSLHLG